MAVRVVGNSFDDDTGYIVLDPSSFHPKSNNPFLFGECVAMLTGFHYSISRCNCANMHNRAWVIFTQPVATPWLSFASKFSVIARQCLVINLIFEVGTKAINSRELLMMLLAIRYFEQHIFHDAWIMLLALCVLLKLSKILIDLLLCFISDCSCLKAGEKGSNLSIRSSKRVFWITLASKSIRILSAEIIFNDAVADNNVSQKDCGISRWAGDAPTNSDN